MANKYGNFNREHCLSFVWIPKIESAPARTGNDKINKITVIEIDQEKKLIWS